MKWIILATALLLTPALAGEPSPAAPPERTFPLTQSGLNQIIAMLQELPAKWANPIMNELVRQVEQAEKAGAPPSPAKGK